MSALGGLAGIFGLRERIPRVIRVFDPSCPLIRSHQGMAVGGET